MSKIYLLIVLSIVLIIGCGQKPPQSASTTARYRLVWNEDPTTKMTIGWDQIKGNSPVICYGNEDFGTQWEKYPLTQEPTRIVPDYRGMNNYFAQLSSLTPDTYYYFVIKDEESVTDRFWFKTAPDQPKPFTFVAGGDTKSGGASLTAGRLSNQMVAKLRPLFVIFNGDFTSGDGTNDERWQLWLNDWTNLTTTADGRMIPIIPVHGNHEDGDSTVLNKLFNAPYQNDNEGNIYFSLSFGSDLFHIIALNSQIDELEEQTKWLEEDLKRHRDFTFKLAGYHKPLRPHTAGKPENEHLIKLWAPLFLEYGLDIGMDGDSHMSKITYPIRSSDEPGSYEGFIRDDENGTMYIGEGSWGAGYRPNNDDKPWTLRSGSFNQIKWIQVFPEIEGNPAHLDIRTVITSKRSAENEDEVVSFVQDVSSLSEENVFAVPDKITLFETEPYGSVITYPFTDKK
jgi:hypothetical protein